VCTIIGSGNLQVCPTFQAKLVCMH
jgi:hypothetical protein